MKYSMIMVSMDLGGPNDAVLRVAAGLAERFKAGVIGVAACHPLQITYADGYVVNDLIELDRAQKEGQIADAEASFRAALRQVADLHWRSSIGYAPLAAYVAEQARSADLVITGPASTASMLDAPRRADVGELVIQLGRPVLVVPPAAQRLELDAVVVGWKDTRETRRAIVDALPLLQQAGRVSVAEIASSGEMDAAAARLADVVGWLGRHGVAAAPVAMLAEGDDAACLDEIAYEHAADLLVTGAYGHNRLREWVLGGVTRTVLRQPSRCSLLSH